MDFLFFLGRTSDIAFQELSSIFQARYPDASLVRLESHIALGSLETKESAVMLQRLLGGTVKVAQVDETTSVNETLALETKAVEILEKLPPAKKISFGIAETGRDSLDALDHIRIKKALQEKEFSVRFVQGPRSGLSASVLLHQNIDEVVVCRIKETIYLGHTIAIQNIDEWSLIDRSKPAADKLHGMLPPKVARMMVNLANPEGTEGKRILDPFCGTGTVVLEAMLLGATAIGADLRVEAVGQTLKNAEWLQSLFQTGKVQPILGKTTKFQVIVADATHINESQLEGKVDSIVAEGYLGPLTPRPGAVPNIYKGLEKLYKGALKNWTAILSPGATLCLALPRMQAQGKVYSMAPLIDSLEGLGYNTSSGPFIYDRPDAVVQREIFVLTFGKIT